MQTKQKTKLIIAAVVVLIVLITAMLFIYNQFGAPQTVGGEKTITVQVTVPPAQPESFTYTTNAEFLSEVLLKESLIEGDDSEYGLFVTVVNGIEADSNKEQWWKLSQNGADATMGFDATPIADNDVFDITLTEGY